MSQEQIIEWASAKEKQLEDLYAKSSLPWGPDKDSIRKLLLECLELHYGSLQGAIVQLDKYEVALRAIKEQIEKIGL